MSYSEILNFFSTVTRGCTDPGLKGYEFSGLDYCIALYAVTSSSSPSAVPLGQACWVPQPNTKQLDDNIVFFLECAKGLGDAARFPGEIETRSYGGARRAVPPQSLLKGNTQPPQLQSNAVDGSGNSSTHTEPHAAACLDDDDNNQLHHQQLLPQQQALDTSSFSMLLFTPDTLQPTKSCFLQHMQVQKWIYQLAGGDADDGDSDDAATNKMAAAANRRRPHAGAAATAADAEATTPADKARSRVLATFDALALRRQHAMPVPLSQRCPNEMAEAFELLASEKLGYRSCWREVESSVMSMLARDAEVDMVKVQHVLLATQPTRVLKS